jgi:sugar lactone lactonase YvrE
MKRYGVIAAAVGAALGMLTAAPASAFDRADVDILTVLPNAVPLPGQPAQPASVEGLTVGVDGNIYVPSFGFNAQGAVAGPATLFAIRPDGSLVREVAIAGSSPHMLGLRFNPVNGMLLVLDFGAGTVLNVNPVTGASSVFATPPTPFAKSSGLNALTFDKQGNAYISDSFNGVIWKAGLSGGTMSAWSSDPLLSPGTGLTPPFGANGIEFTNDGMTVLVANTAFHQIIQIPVNPDGTAGTASIFITGINAPDGIAIDKDGNIWVCANQEDDVIVLDKTGKVIAKLGDFDGIDENGIARNFAFPASLAFSLDGKTLYVSNLTLFLPFAGANAAVDSPWMLLAKHYTVSKLRAVIPPLDGNDH